MLRWQKGNFVNSLSELYQMFTTTSCRNCHLGWLPSLHFSPKRWYYTQWEMATSSAKVVMLVWTDWWCNEGEVLLGRERCRGEVAIITYINLWRVAGCVKPPGVEVTHNWSDEIWVPGINNGNMTAICHTLGAWRQQCEYISGVWSGANTGLHCAPTPGCPRASSAVWCQQLLTKLACTLCEERGE